MNMTQTLTRLEQYENKERVRVTLQVEAICFSNLIWHVKHEIEAKTDCDIDIRCCGGLLFKGYEIVICGETWKIKQILEWLKTLG